MSGLTYARKVKIILAHLGKTQAEFAQLIQTTLPTVRGWEQENHSDPNPAARALIDIFFAEPVTAKELLEKGRQKTKEIDP